MRISAFFCRPGTCRVCVAACDEIALQASRASANDFSVAISWLLWWSGDFTAVPGVVGYAAPRSTGRGAALHHSLQLPAKSAVCPSPAISMASRLGKALTPLPHWCTTLAGSRPASRGANSACNSAAGLKRASAAPVRVKGGVERGGDVAGERVQGVALATVAWRSPGIDHGLARGLQARQHLGGCAQLAQRRCQPEVRRQRRRPSPPAHPGTPPASAAPPPPPPPAPAPPCQACSPPSSTATASWPAHLSIHHRRAQ